MLTIIKNQDQLLGTELNFVSGFTSGSELCKLLSQGITTLLPSSNISHKYFGMNSNGEHAINL